MGDEGPQLCLGRGVGGKPSEATEGVFKPFHGEVRTLEAQPAEPPDHRPLVGPRVGCPAEHNADPQRVGELDPRELCGRRADEREVPGGEGSAEVCIARALTRYERMFAGRQGARQARGLGRP
jgi:hypothetical protein